MIEIAETLGLVKGTLYRCVKSKEELFLVILERQMERWLNEIDAWLADVEVDDPISRAGNWPLAVL